MQEISSSLNAEAVRLLAAIIRNSRHKPRGRRWNFEEKILALSLLKRSPKSCILQILFPHSSGRSLQSLLNTVPFRNGITTHVFYALRHSLQKKYMKKTATVVSCLMKCRSERMSGLIRNLTALGDLRILEVRAGHATCSTFHCPWSA